MKTIKKKEFITLLPSKLSDGEIRISGYKHASNLIIIAAILLPNIKFKLKNIPDVLDTRILLEILEFLGANVCVVDDCYEINTQNIQNRKILTEFTEKVHGTLYLLPALLCRFGEVMIGKSGGCPIGEQDEFGNSRPIAHIISVLEEFGARFTFEGNYLYGKMEKLQAPEFIDLQKYSDDPVELTGQYVSGATKTAILAALASQSEIVLKKPYIKADVRELLRFLTGSGVEILQTKDTLKIKNTHTYAYVNYFVMSDINEIFTYITFSVINGVNLKLTNITIPSVYEAYIQENILLAKMGITLRWEYDAIYVPRTSAINSFHVDIGQAEKYSIYADHQPFLALLSTLANKNSIIRDRVWKTRFQYVPELIKLGYYMRVYDGELHVYPKKNECDKPVILYGNDVRATAVLIIASLKAKQAVKIFGIEHLERGYVSFIEKLQSLGAKIIHEESKSEVVL